MDAARFDFVDFGLGDGVAGDCALACSAAECEERLPRVFADGAGEGHDERREDVVARAGACPYW